MGKELDPRLAFLGRAAVSGFGPSWQWLGKIEAHVSKIILVKSALVVGSGLIAASLGREDDMFRVILGGSVASIVALVFLILGAYRVNRDDRLATPDNYLKLLPFDEAIKRETPDKIGVELPVVNKTAYRVRLHERRRRILLDGCLSGSATVELGGGDIEPHGRGFVRVMIPRSDADKEIDIENLRIMARVSDARGKIVCDVFLRMPERQGFIFSPIIGGGGYQLGTAQHGEAHG